MPRTANSFAILPRKSSVQKSDLMMDQQPSLSSLLNDDSRDAVILRGLTHQEDAPPAASAAKAATPGGPASTFPLKLHKMLNDAEAKGFDHIVRWESKKAFKVFDLDLFASQVMRQYFGSQNKYKSFQRQLNLYGFRRIHHGPHKGGYAHKLFIRDQPELSQQMVRQKPGGIAAPAMSAVAAAAKVVAATPPSAQASSFMHATPLKSHVRKSTLDMVASGAFDGIDPLFLTGSFVFDEEDPALLMDATPSQQEHTRNASQLFSLSGVDYEKLFSAISSQDPTDGAWNLDCQNQGGLQTDIPSMGDLPFQEHHHTVSGSEAASDSGSVTTAEETVQEEEDEDGLDKPHAFPYKLHEMLEEAHAKGFTHIVSWCLDGTGFKVHAHDLFLSQVMPRYFDQSKYESFRRQLNLYGFVRFAKGPNRGVYQHDLFRRDAPHQCHLIVRPKKKR